MGLALVFCTDLGPGGVFFVLVRDKVPAAGYLVLFFERGHRRVSGVSWLYG